MVADLAGEEAVRGQLREVQPGTTAVCALQRSLQQRTARVQVALAVAHDAPDHPFGLLRLGRRLSTDRL